jgi:molybdenum cofactor synthesis domain-containing protein
MSNPVKKISFMATGNEIIEGDTLDTNGNYFARTLADLGVTIYQHLCVSDNIEEICTGLRYLLAHSDAVITVGGLGPTSDDLTRFAVAKVTDKNLEFDENSWKNIEERFKKFRLRLVPSNRQQAMFPAGATVLPNENGSAPACQVEWQGKLIFMVPGPPKECRPIFNEKIIPVLKENGFLNKKPIFRWLTLGLSESEIGEKIDALAKPFGFETGFRWHYPYLEIKVMAQDTHPLMEHIEEINQHLSSYCVSRDRQKADTLLEACLNQGDEPIYIVNEAIDENLCTHPRLIYTSSVNAADKKQVFILRANPKISTQLDRTGTITLSCESFLEKKCVHQHELTIPIRGPEIAQYAKAYMAWQLTRSLKPE